MRDRPPRRPRKAPRKGRPGAARPADERRTNQALREVLDELLAYVRSLCRTIHTMSPSEIEYAQQRVEWLAEEVWRLALDGSGPS